MQRKDCLLFSSRRQGKGVDKRPNYSFLILTPDGGKITTAQFRIISVAWGD